MVQELIAFDVKDAATDIRRNYILEASAGTGKTYSIENIVVRLLLEEKCPIEQILVVTFTRAATRDLKWRIREKLAVTLESIKTGITDPPYLENIENREEAKRAIHQALLAFDQAPIETIHGFCSRMLREHLFEANMGSAIGDKDEVDDAVLIQIIHDFFRTGLDPKKYSAAQVSLLLNKHKANIERLQKAILHEVKRGYAVAKIADFSELFSQFCALSHSFSFETEKLIADFDYLVSCRPRIKVDSEIITKFSEAISQKNPSRNDFDYLIGEDLAFLTKCDPETNPTKGYSEEKMHYPGLISLLKSKLVPLLQMAGNKDLTLGRIVSDCYEMVSRYLDEEELMRFDDLLTNMQRACSNENFRDKIRKKYRAAIIDEFQDTDPIQWQIFKELFTDWDGYLYLVGDPKQSIYAFRNADIYTYLDAAETLGRDHMASLATNYRSTHSLVEGLNALFSVPGLIWLPRLETALPYYPVNSNKIDSENPIKDQLSAIHFILGNEKAFLPYIVQQIQNLTEFIEPSSIAILVCDRFQAEETSQFLKKYGIPHSVKRQGGVCTEAFYALKELIQAILLPKDRNLLKMALGGPLFGWGDQDIVHLEDENVLETTLALFYELQQILTKDGFGSFIRAFLKKTSCSIIGREDGLLLYEDLQQLIEMILVQESKSPLSPEGIFSYLKNMEASEEESDKKYTQANTNAVQIITMHSSKGLEFDVVFALGINARRRPPSKLIPNHESHLLEVVINENDPKYRLYCEEMDAEKMRLLYVTLTRAKYRLYIPAVEHEEPAEAGCAAPWEIYSKKLGEPIQEFVSKKPGLFSFTQLGEEEISLIPSAKQEYADLLAPEEVVIPGKNRFIHSFSSLSKPEHPFYEEQPPHDLNPTIKTIHNLPAGNETGIILHRLLEKIPIRHYSSHAEIAEEIAPFIYENDYKPWQDVMAQSIYNALNVTLDGFCLADVDPKQIYREMEFLYPLGNTYLANELNDHDNLLKGVVDLAFTHNGKYYLLDWKSNWLGSNDEAYNQTNLQEAIRQHQYDLQANIYTEAYRRFLALVEPRPFQECFGGIFYLFLRSNNGVFRLGL